MSNQKTDSETKTVKITSITNNLGIYGVIKTINGLVLWTGDVRPFGFTKATRNEAESYAERMGWTVVE